MRARSSVVLHPIQFHYTAQPKFGISLRAADGRAHKIGMRLTGNQTGCACYVLGFMDI